MEILYPVDITLHLYPLDITPAPTPSPRQALISVSVFSFLDISCEWDYTT